MITPGTAPTLTVFICVWVCGVDFPLQKATISFFSPAQDLKTSQASHTNTERPTSSDK